MDDKEHVWDEGRGYLRSADGKADREPLRSRIIGTIGVILSVLIAAGFVALYSKQANAQAVEIPVHVHESDAAKIRLMPGPCQHAGILGYVTRIDPERKFRHIESEWRHPDGSLRPHTGCWAEFSKEEAGEATFFMLFDDGERYAITRKKFLKKTGTDT